MDGQRTEARRRTSLARVKRTIWFANIRVQFQVVVRVGSDNCPGSAANHVHHGEPKGQNLCYRRQMSRADCKVCVRNDKEEIEDIAVSKGPRAAGRAAGCSHNAIMRHMKKHLNGATSETPSFEAVEPTPPLSVPTLSAPKPKQKPIPVYPPSPAAVVPYKQRFPRIAALQTAQERRQYLAELFRLGRFHGFQTTGHLSLLWDDLGPCEFAELVTQAATEANFRRGSEQARRAALVSQVEVRYREAVKAKDRKTAARLLETWGRLDVPVGVDMLTALMSTTVWPILARVLRKKDPALIEELQGELVAEESRKRQALAPMTVESSQDG